MRRFIRLSAIIGCVLIGVIAGLWWSRSGVHLEAIITNTGAIPMVDSSVTCAQQTIDIGDLLPGETRTVRFKPRTDSNIRLSCKDENGIDQIINVDCYVTGGTVGKILIEVTDGKTTRIDDQTRIHSWNF